MADNEQIVCCIYCFKKINLNLTRYLNSRVKFQQARKCSQIISKFILQMIIKSIFGQALKKISSVSIYVNGTLKLVITVNQHQLLLLPTILILFPSLNRLYIARQ